MKPFITFKNKIFAILLLFQVMLSSITYAPVYADSVDIAYLRAKVEFTYDDECVALDNSSLVITNENWIYNEDDGWYYYLYEVDPGDVIRFIEGVIIPDEWDNETSDHEFAVVITGQIADAVYGDEGWDENTDIIYDESYETFTTRYEADDSVYIQKSTLKLTINEYELDEDGNEVEYENDKVVVAGQYVSKIVEFVISGKKGSLVDIELEEPIKHVYWNGIDVNGWTNITPGSTLLYTITVTNTAPDDRTITITDSVDPRLTVINTGGAIITKSIVTLYGTSVTLEWNVDVAAGETATVYFSAVTPTSWIGTGITIPNTAVMALAGQEAKTNTVIISMGTVSGFMRGLTQFISRHTGDAANVPLFISILITGTAALIVVLIYWIIKKIRPRKEYGAQI